MSVEQLKVIMFARGLNNVEVAKLLNVQPWTIGAWLKGQRNISRKYVIAINSLYSEKIEIAEATKMPEVIKTREGVKKLIELQDAYVNPAHILYISTNVHPTMGGDWAIEIKLINGEILQEYEVDYHSAIARLEELAELFSEAL